MRRRGRPQNPAKLGRRRANAATLDGESSRGTYEDLLPNGIGWPARLRHSGSDFLGNDTADFSGLRPEIEKDQITVLIYVDTSKQVGDRDHLKVFANADASETWFEGNDPEGVAFEYDVLELMASAAGMSRRDGQMVPAGSGPMMMARIRVMKALNRHVEQAFNPERKDTHW